MRILGPSTFFRPKNIPILSFTFTPQRSVPLAPTASRALRRPGSRMQPNLLASGATTLSTDAELHSQSRGRSLGSAFSWEVTYDGGSCPSHPQSDGADA